MAKTYGNGQLLRLKSIMTVRTDVYKQVIKAAHRGATQPLERQIRVEFHDPVWEVQVGYWNGNQFLVYRLISDVKNWSDVEKIVENLTTNYLGRIKILGFDAGNRLK
ncbi:MAG: hypothetical protein MN733_14240 [Nitrososphaera sp.]|nr:hypothetical protein [Nitrososphaera sp.]